MKIYKFLIYYYIIQLVYKIVIAHKKTENNNINNNINNIFDINLKYFHKDLFDNKIENSNNKIENSNKLNKITKKKLNNIYKKKLIEKKNLFIKNNNNIEKEELLIKKEKIILNDMKEKIILNDNKDKILLINNTITYNFQPEKNFLYKITFKSNISNKYSVKNTKIIISSSNKFFEYDFCNNNIIEKDIKNYGFVLDNNNFEFKDNIQLKIIYYSIDNKKIELDNVSIEIIEKEFNIDKLSIIIFNLNKIYYPLYYNEYNILDYKENSNEELFFM